MLLGAAVLVLVGAAAAGLAPLNKRAQLDQIHSLPGLSSNFKTRQFSGYLATTAKNRHLHYWHVESQVTILDCRRVFAA